MRVNVTLQPWAGKRCWVTEIEAGGDTFLFYAPADVVSRQVREIETLVASEMRASRDPVDAISNLEAIGGELTAVLLQHDTAESARAERAAAREALAAARGPVIYKLGAPVPIELLAFDDPIGGVGRFERMMGGRPEASSQNGRRPGRVVGSGAVLFHDDLVPSCIDGEVHDAIDLAFPNGVEPHQELRVADRRAAQVEINRLFKGASASWVHFQCHAIEDEELRALRLSANYKVTQRSFTEPGGRIAAIMLNACSGARVGAWWGASSEIPEGSWAEYFTGDCGVPAVIGSFCPVLDGRTMPFTRRFYGRLSQEDRVFDAFSSARAELMDGDDVTAFAYRYVGPTELIVPEQARIVAYAPDLRRAA